MVSHRANVDHRLSSKPSDPRIVEASSEHHSLAKLGAGHFTVPPSERIEQLSQPMWREECSVLHSVPQRVSDQRWILASLDQVRDRSLDCHGRQPVDVRHIGRVEYAHP